ncbi:hypothetical protein [Spirillospora sp. CA-294931]|uniref:hypothetical protein n=1 Tax=Spirillospora sp. CA-294931 TaxID=3240042 RepID=UPI003D8A9AF8
MSDYADVTEIYEAARDFVEVWAEEAQTLPCDYGCTMTCSEAETLAILLRAFGKTEVADSMLAEHAEYDEPGDMHYEGELG